MFFYPATVHFQSCTLNVNKNDVVLCFRKLICAFSLEGFKVRICKISDKSDTLSLNYSHLFRGPLFFGTQCIWNRGLRIQRLRQNFNGSAQHKFLQRRTTDWTLFVYCFKLEASIKPSYREFQQNWTTNSRFNHFDIGLQRRPETHSAVSVCAAVAWLLLSNQ